MSKYTTDGMTVTNGEGFMGIFSTVSLLNDKIDRIKHLEQRLKEAEEVIGFYDSIKGWDQGKKTGETSYQRARAYFKKYGEKEEV